MRRDALSEVPFYCSDCKHGFEAEPSRVVDAPELTWNPYDYFAVCPQCDREVGEASWSRALRIAHGKSTGPRTPEGLAATSKNLEGHPTPEEALRTRFNGMRNGAHARVATYFPAKPGKYPICESCEYLNNGCNDEFNRMPGHKNPVACLKRTELFMQHHIAWETQDPKMLLGLQSELHSMMHAIITDMLMAIAQDGVALRTPEWYYDKDGGFHLAEYADREDPQVKHLIYKIEAHPLLKPLTQMMASMGMTLPDSNMTVRSQEDAETIRGYVDAEEDDREHAKVTRERAAGALENLQDLIKRSQHRQAQDPVLQEFESGQEAED